VTATVNGFAATIANNTGNTLTVEYIFPATETAGTVNYEKAASIEPGTQYLIVAQSGGKAYALMNMPSDYNSGYLQAVEITVSGDLYEHAVTSAVNGNLLWTFDNAEASGAFNITNGGDYLRRRSSRDNPTPPEGGIYTNAEYKSEAYSDWLTDSGKLYIIDNSNDNQYLNLASSDGKYYFRLVSEDGMALSLYKIAQSTVPDIDIHEVGIAVVQPVAGAAPNTAAAARRTVRHTLHHRRPGIPRQPICIR
jgi:hypothetical protein